jgi:hypothetical protein
VQQLCAGLLTNVVPVDVPSSSGQFYDQYLRSIHVNTESISWSSADLNYLSSRTAYKRWLWEKLRASQRITMAEVNSRATQGRDQEFRVEYDSTAQLDGILTQMNMMTDHKAGIPRTSFDGVLQFTRFEQMNRIWIVPTNSPYTRMDQTP